MFIGNIVNIVQHSHSYNSFLLIIVLLYGSDVQLYNEKAFKNNIKSIYMYPAHIYTTQYKETKLHQSCHDIKCNQ
jgi:hypothetical protein